MNLRAKTVIKYDKNGNVKKIVSSAGQTRHNKAAFELHCNNTEPTFGMKLRRFMRRVRLTALHYADNVSYNCHHPAAAMPYIGIEEQHEHV